MPVCLSGLDLSFLKDPANRLPPPEPKDPGPDFSAKRAEGIASPFFMPDIKPFVQVSTREPSVISSRTELRRFERATGLKQAGDIKPGTIAAENNAKKAELVRKSKGVEHGWTDYKP
jgi:hypothetical protein